MLGPFPLPLRARQMGSRKWVHERKSGNLTNEHAFRKITMGPVLINGPHYTNVRPARTRGGTPIRVGAFGNAGQGQLKIHIPE
jgi:hypothetical protein